MKYLKDINIKMKYPICVYKFVLSKLAGIKKEEKNQENDGH